MKETRGRKLLLLVFVSLMLTALTACSNSKGSFEKAVKDGDYKKAIEIYQADIDGNTNKENEAGIFLNQYANDSLTEFASGKINKDSIDSILSTLEKVNGGTSLLNNLGEIKQKVASIKNAKEFYEKGMEAFSSKAYLDAILLFQNVTSDDTEHYNEAQSKIKEARSSYEEAVLQEAQGLVSKGEYYNALACLEGAMRNVGNADKFTNKVTEIKTAWENDAIQTAQGYLEAAQYGEAYQAILNAYYSLGMTDKLQKAYDEIEVEEINGPLFAQGQKAMADGKPDEAIKAFAKIAEQYKGFDETQLLLKEAAESWQKQLLDKTDDYLAKGELAAAVDYLKKSKGELPDRKILKTISTALDEKYTEVYGLWREDVKQSALRKAEEYATNQDYATALAYLKDGLSKIGDEEELTSMINTYEEAWRQIRIEEAVAEAKGLYEKGELEAAITVLNKAVDQLGSDPTMTAMQGKYINQYREAAIKKAEEIYEPYNEESIYGAEDVIKDAIQFLGKDDNLKEVLNRYLDLRPKSRNEMIRIGRLESDSRQGFAEYVLTTLDRSRSSSVLSTYRNGDSYGTEIYNVDGEFSRLVGKFATRINNSVLANNQQKYDPRLTIFVDGHKAFSENISVYNKNTSSQNIYDNWDCIEFEIDLHGVEKLELSLYSYYISGYVSVPEGPLGFLFDLEFWK